MEEKSLLLQFTGDAPLFKIIDFLVDNVSTDFSKKDIAEGAGISRASLFAYWEMLEKYGLVKVTRCFGKTKLYTLDTKNVVVKKILELEKALIVQAMEKTQKKKVLVCH